MTQTTLRKLARGYADSQISKEEYRKSRAEFVEGILSGDVELHVNQYLPPIKIPSLEEELENTSKNQRMKEAEEGEEDVTAFSPPPATDSITSTATSEPMPSASGGTASIFSKKYLIFGICAGVVLITLVISLLLPDPDKSTSSTTQAENTALPEKNSTQTGQSRASKLIREFLRSKNWSTANINSFIINWRSLSAEDQASVSGSIELSQLTSAIYKKLLEEQALSGLGDGQAAMEKQRKLVSFADDLGINDPRIKLAQ